MAKLVKKNKKRLANGKPKKVAKGKIEKKRIDKKRQRQNGDVDQDTSLVMKKRPSKAELKSVIEALKKEASLLLVRKALKYIPFYLKSEGLIKKLLKEIIRLWAEAGEKVRVICLLCLVRIFTKLEDEERKQLIMKKLYASFMEKCRITKSETMSMISFMRHSLIELFKLDAKIAYKQAQSSCQQMTLTLKNAFTHKNEETYKTVLNWQFANCLILLSNLVVAYEDDSPIKSLAHQIVQLNLGAINLLISPRYYAFYCHLIENLIGLSIATNLFIPILPIMMGILDKLQAPLAKKVDKRISKSDDSGNEDDVESERGSPKEYNMDLLNHVSLDEAHSFEYQKAVIDKLFELLVRYLNSQCHKIAFPELVLLPMVQLKKWIKKNPGQPAQKFKVLFDKVKTISSNLEEARSSVNFEFTNYPAVDAWEKRAKDSNKVNLLKLLDK